eukprot:gene28572-35455_t
MAFKFELKAADQALSRGAFSDGLVFTKSSMKLAEELAELQVVVEVIEGAIAEMMNNDAPSKIDSVKPNSPTVIKSVLNLTSSVSIGVNKTLIEYQKLKKEAELTIVKRRRADAQSSHTAKMALLKGRSANEGLNWQPSFIASKRETSHLNLSHPPALEPFCICHFASLVDMYELSDNVQSEADKTSFLAETLLRGHSKLYEKDLETDDYEASFSHQLDLDLPRDEDNTTHFVNNVTETSIKKKREHQPHETSTSPAAMNFTCSIRDKIGHSTADCWSKEICEKCGKKGYIGSVCRFTCSTKDQPKPDSRPSE